MLCTIWTNESESFWNFGYSGQNSQNSCHFWNNRSVFLLNFASVFRVMRHDSSAYTFLSKILYTFNKRSLEKYVNLVKFYVSSRKSELFHFDEFLWSKSCTVQPEKYKWVISHDTEQWCEIWRKNYFFLWKMTWELWWILTQAVKNIKICALMGYLCKKYVMFELK